jgi:hypothetical protein
MIEKVLQNERRTCRNDGTEEPRTVTLSEATVEMPVGKQIVNGEVVDLPPMTLPSIAGQDVNVLGSLGLNSDISSISNSKAYSAIVTSLQGLSGQAGILKNFFETAAGTYSSKEATFTALKDAQTGIKTEVSSVNGNVSTFDTRINNRIDGILDNIFGDSGASRTEFDNYLKAYQSGTYVVTRDWITKDGVNLTPKTFAGLGSNFNNDVAAIGMSMDGNDFTPRGTYEITELGNWQYEQLMTNIKNGMKTRITDALGLTGVTNADTMALALINQMQDFEEFRALIDDFKAATALNKDGNTSYADLTLALDYNYDSLITQPQPQPQSSVRPVRLAHVDAQFQPDAIKTAYGKLYEQYTDAFTPRKENETADTGAGKGAAGSSHAARAI